TTTQTLVLAVLSCRKRCDSQPTAFYSFFNDTATTEIYTLSLHDALPISVLGPQMVVVGAHHDRLGRERRVGPREDPDDIHAAPRSEEHTSELQSRGHLVCRLLLEKKKKQTCTTRLQAAERRRRGSRTLRP